MAKSLNESYKDVNRIYSDRNYYRSLESIYCHFIEVSKGLISSVTKNKPENAEAFLAKSIGWWFAVCGKVGIKNVEDMIWAKYPMVCPYCQKNLHDGGNCKGSNPDNDKIRWESLQQIGNASNVKPTSLKDWQIMFQKIYPRVKSGKQEQNVEKLSEEIGELSEAIRAISIEPKYFFSEAPDVFAWLMGFANQFDAYKDLNQKDFGNSLEKQFLLEYPGGCKACGWPICKCPPILSSTLGRIAKDVPLDMLFPKDRNMFSIDDSIKMFSEVETSIRIGERIITPNQTEFSNILKDIQTILNRVEEIKSIQPKILSGFSAQLGQLNALVEQGIVNQKSIDRITDYFRTLPSNERQTLIDFMNNIAASSTITAVSTLFSSLSGIRL